MSDLEETRALASQTINETYQLLRLIEKLESPMIAPMPQNSPTEERTRGHRSERAANKHRPRPGGNPNPGARLLGTPVSLRSELHWQLTE